MQKEGSKICLRCEFFRMVFSYCAYKSKRMDSKDTCEDWRRRRLKAKIGDILKAKEGNK